MAEIRSPLGEAAAQRRGADPSITEIIGRDLVQMAGWPDTFPAATAKLAGMLGLAVPDDTRHAGAAGDTTVFRVAPERLWLAAPVEDGLAVRLRAAFAAEEAVVTEIGHSRAIFRVAGLRAPALLARAVAVDLDPSAFPVGAFAQTALHQAGALVHRSGEVAFDLYVMRTYARAVWSWLADMADIAGAAPS